MKIRRASLTFSECHVPVEANWKASTAVASFVFFLKLFHVVKGNLSFDLSRARHEPFSIFGKRDPVINLALRMHGAW